MRTPKEKQTGAVDRSKIGRPRRHRYLANKRVGFSDSCVILSGWPSRGGYIFLLCSSALDLIFLNIDPVSLSSESLRDEDQDAEDAFCQRLLLLGAKWFDSYARFLFICGVEDERDEMIQALEESEQPMPTKMERRWVSVAWPPDEEGVWVLESDTQMWGPRERSLPPSDAVKLAMASDMRQKAVILKEMGARFFKRLEDYEGCACLNAWKTKVTGEHGPLVYLPWDGYVDEDAPYETGQGRSETAGGTGGSDEISLLNRCSII